MDITDAQIHIWSSVTAGGLPHRPAPFGVDDAIRDMDSGGVNRAILILPTWSADPNDFAVAAAGKHPGRLAVMGRARLEDRAGLAALIDSWHVEDNLLGVRIVSRPTDDPDRLNGADRMWFWDAAAELGVPVMLYAPGGGDAVGGLLERYPGLRLVLDHCNLALDARDMQVEAEIDALVTLAKYPNLAIKLSALPRYLNPDYPLSGVVACLRRLTNAFGVERLFWGSDITRMTGSYADVVAHFVDTFGSIWEPHLEWIMGRGLSQWLGWEAAAPAPTRE